MSVLSLRLPNSMHDDVRNIAMREEISINQFIMLAIAEKLASMDTAEYLKNRAKRGSREKLLAVLSKAPDVEPEKADQI
ncbi:MAG: toxin-antitoxin system HicB family antitoxin [Chloroflexota bacterium]